MGDISLTAANIRPLPDNGSILRRHIAGGTITIGQLVSLSADGFVDPADGNVADGVLARPIGIAVASNDGETSIVITEPVTVCVFGPVSGYSGMTPGDNHYLSDTAGRIADAVGTYDKIVGYAESATVLFVHIEQIDASSA